MTRKATQSIFVTLSITIIYLTNVANTGLNWFLLRSLVRLAGQPKEAFFIACVSTPPWVQLVSDILFFILSTVADGLLVSITYAQLHRQFTMCAPSPRYGAATTYGTGLSVQSLPPWFFS